MLLGWRKNDDPCKYSFSGYVTGLYGRGCFLLSDNSRIGKNVIISGANVSSSLLVENKKKDILILGKGLTDKLDDITLTEEAESCINFSKTQQKNWLSLHNNGNNSFLFVSEVKIYQMPL